MIKNYNNGTFPGNYRDNRYGKEKHTKWYCFENKVIMKIENGLILDDKKGIFTINTPINHGVERVLDKIILLYTSI